MAIVVGVGVGRCPQQADWSGSVCAISRLIELHPAKSQRIKNTQQLHNNTPIPIQRQ